ncbi:PSD1 and planctomycete cytochrome C domain-containing protein [Prosthecobacter sp.]|uniref:PSD1 and planctomycete cytochrome C domain-containing protein n=1 Tax=Prosthecobacter sp. TaxID=1965333 RepID=UPI003783D109
MPLSAVAGVEFNRDVRPILSDTCFHCHGPDAGERKGGLRLDVREEALKPAKSGETAIVPGKPDESELIRRVLTDDDSDLMPPQKLHKPLTAKQKETLKAWIQEGAVYQGHWAFTPLVKPAVPAVKSSEKIENGVDAFIRARLDKAGMKPSEEADRATLIRRVSLDLTGLPPELSEIERFEKDSSPDAYEKVVDRLLASDHYGERMAMQWLDFARYADSHGFQSDSSRQMWPWRDWVIQAFNHNMPFDQFTIEQLAGDLLPQASQSQIIATGFNRNHRLNGEGGIIGEEWRIETVIDRLETVGSTWLGLTFNCCRCHDHKYDPIRQKDFYSFLAFFNNVPETGTFDDKSKTRSGNITPVVEVTTPEQGQKLAALEAAVKNAEADLARARQSLGQLVSKWEAKVTPEKMQAIQVWKRFDADSVESQGGATLSQRADGSYLVSGKVSRGDTYVIKGQLPEVETTGLLIECLPDASLPAGGPGRGPKGAFVLDNIGVDVITDDAGNPMQAPIARVVAGASAKGWDAGLLASGERIKKIRKGWNVPAGDRKPQRAMLVFEKPLPAGARMVITLGQSALPGQSIGCFRLGVSSLRRGELTLTEEQEREALVAAMRLAPARRSKVQREAIESYYLTHVANPVTAADDLLKAARNAVETFRKGLVDVMVMQEMPRPRDAFVLERGEYDKPRDKAEMATPAFLPPMPPSAPKNRLGLAQWITDAANPLTARVWVNRTWEKFFGIGLCKTTENLGSQSEWPVHPELLDWLACEFMSMKWDMKAFQKMLVMSRTYRQSSKLSPEAILADPENRLLARGPRFRLDGESVRDQALHVAELLVGEVGGPSVRPYMPAGVWDETSKYGNLLNYTMDKGPGAHRRSLYTIWKRTAAPPSMLLFDAPSRETCVVKRSRTDTPLQALALLNEVSHVEAACALGALMQKQCGQMEDQIAYGYRKATCHTIVKEDLELMAAAHRQRLRHFKEHPAEAAAFLSFGGSNSDHGSPEAAAMAATAAVLLNLDRVVTRD